MTKTIDKTKIEKLASLINDGIESWKAAGVIVVELLDGGMSLQEIADECPELNKDIISRFEQIGRNQVMPRLLIASFPAAKHIMKLPYSEQTRLMDGRVEVIVAVTDKGVDTLNIATRDLTNEQCKQVFGKSAVRDIAGQRAWMESERRKTSLNRVDLVHDMPYHIVGKHVVFRSSCKLSASDIIRILVQIEK